MAITSEAYSPIFKRGEDMEISVKWMKIKRTNKMRPVDSCLLK